jgi:Zn-finger protein
MCKAYIRSILFAKKLPPLPVDVSREMEKLDHKREFHLGRAALKIKPGETFTVKMQLEQNSLLGHCPVCRSKKFMLSNVKKDGLQIHGCLDCKTMWTEEPIGEIVGGAQVIKIKRWNLDD